MGHSVAAPLWPLQALELIQKRLKQTDSSTCRDCGMDPQDVHHLFNCTAHLTMDPQDVHHLFNCTAHLTALTTEFLWNSYA